MSFYIEIPVMLVMYTAWLFFKRLPITKAGDTIITDTPHSAPLRSSVGVRWFDLANPDIVDLHRDEYNDTVDDSIEDQQREARLKGPTRWLWKLYYYIA